MDSDANSACCLTRILIPPIWLRSALEPSRSHQHAAEPRPSVIHLHRLPPQPGRLAAHPQDPMKCQVVASIKRADSAGSAFVFCIRSSPIVQHPPVVAIKPQPQANQVSRSPLEIIKMVGMTNTLLALGMALGSAAKLASRATGEVTYFFPGIGACGERNGDGDAVAALSASLFDAERPCNRNIRVSYQGRSVTVRVVDRCQGCAHNDVDLSPSAFQRVIGDLALGRKTASWEWA